MSRLASRISRLEVQRGSASLMVFLNLDFSDDGEGSPSLACLPDRSGGPSRLLHREAGEASDTFRARAQMETV